ncbi:PTS sugar transporter subunit IIC [Erysipelothrix inopinata]|uniref:Permease IIC component n=1 Tax=Erysipelothrix inopinata TaxID=225084 RepID=A0A7G9RYP6_9FIRM|nr:PTS transporter subunit EIIC [Erysipelothrix inopinata]QNN60721.1 PTS sugar transporter subunit IIC [Erysipelothrix inopinata]
MQKISNFVEEKLAPPLIRFSQLKYVQVMQFTGLGIMSLLIIGSLFLLLASFPSKAYLNFLGDFRWTIAQVAGIGTNYIGLFTVFTTSYALVDWYNRNRGETNEIVQPVILAAACFLLLNPVQTLEVVVKNSTETTMFTGVSQAFLGADGVFTGIIVAIVSVEIYRFFLRKKVTIKMPEGVPPMVANVFAGLIPSIFVVVFWWVLGSVLNINIGKLITGLFTPLLQVGDTPLASGIIVVIDRILWSVGIHGSNTISPITGTYMTQMVAANQAAFAAGEALPYTYTTLFLDNYVWTSVVPLVILLVMSKKPRLKGLGALSLPGSIFNIAEPVIFGLPIMLNPLMMIPFILSAVVLLIMAVIGSSLHILPTPVLSIPWITPAPIKAFLSTGGRWEAAAFVIIGWIVSFLIYYPFFKILEKNEELNMKSAKEHQ